jgi:hypothetical protein
VVVVPEYGKPTKRCIERSQYPGDRVGRQPAAPEQLHIYKVTAMQHQIRFKRCSLIHYRRQARDIIRM